MLSSKFIFFVLICIIFKDVFGYDIVNCSSTNPKHTLKKDTLTILQTPNFPRTISPNTYTLPCNVEIQSTDHMWITMLNGQTNSISFYGSQNISNVLQIPHYSSNSDILTYTTFNGSLFVKIDEKFSPQTWTAFQAAVVSFSVLTTDKCPLSKQTFDFNANPDIIVPVVSEWRQEGGVYVSKFCNWAFTIGEKQQLKIVVKKVKPSSDFILSLYADNKIVKNFTDTVTPDVITPGLYFSGTNFNLTFSNQWSNSSNSGFFLLVSAFTPSTIPIPSGCREPNTTGSTTIFTNIDYNSGYQPYQHCENNFTIPANFEVSVAITQPFYEACCDILSIKYGGNSNQISLTNGISAVYKLNHNIGEAKLVFDSDGNNQQAGYLAVVESYKCVCGPQKTFVQCDGQTGIFPTGSGLYYCDNMNCNYQIVQNASCPNAYISVFVSHVLRPQIDHLILKSNGQFNKDFTNNTKYFSPAYISETFYYSMPKNNVTFDFTSGQNGDISTDSKIWSAYIKTVPSPKFINITLDQNKSKHVQWLADMNENEALRVCAKTGTLEIFVTYDKFSSLYHFALYDSDDLNNFVGLLSSDALNSSSPYIPPNRKSTSGCFTLYFNSDVVLLNTYTVLFRIHEESTKYCQDPNVYQMLAAQHTAQTQYDISIRSTDSGSCEMIILAFAFSLPHVWIANITATSNAKYTFKNTVDDKKLFDIDASEVSQWQSFGIYTQALSIISPPSSGIAVHLTNADQTLAWITVIRDGTQKGVMSYNNNLLRTSDTLKLYQANNYEPNGIFTANFAVKEILGNPIVLIEHNGQNQTLNKDVTIKTNDFSIFYEAANPEFSSFLIEYTIQTKNSVIRRNVGYLLFLMPVILIALKYSFLL